MAGSSGESAIAEQEKIQRFRCFSIFIEAHGFFHVLYVVVVQVVKVWLCIELCQIINSLHQST